jgi:hypothetical protein
MSYARPRRGSTAAAATAAAAAAAGGVAGPAAVAALLALDEDRALEALVRHVETLPPAHVVNALQVGRSLFVTNFINRCV